MICRILKVSAGRSEHRGAPPHGVQPPRGAPSTNCNLWVLPGRISAHFFYQINSPVHVGPCHSGRLPSPKRLSLFLLCGNGDDGDYEGGGGGPRHQVMSNLGIQCVGMVNQVHLFTRCVCCTIRDWDHSVAITELMVAFYHTYRSLIPHEDLLGAIKTGLLRFRVAVMLNICD